MKHFRVSTAQAAAIIVIAISALVFIASVYRLLHTRAEIVYTTIQDDSFYYILPAWNAFHHELVSFDLINKTYGFQPGYFVALYLMAPFASNAHGLTVISLIFNFLCYSLTGFVAYCAVKNAAPRKHLPPAIIGGLAAVAAFFANGLSYLSSQTGKENALAALLLSVAIYISQRLRSFEPPRESLKGFVLLGAVFALLALTRIHPATAISMALIALYSVDNRVFSRKSVAIGITFFALFAPWFLFSKAYFGNAFPTSGALKSGSFGLNIDGISSYYGYLQTYLERIAKFTFGYPNSFFLLQTDVDKFTPQASLPAKLLAWLSIALASIAMLYSIAPVGREDRSFRSFVRLCSTLFTGSFVGHALLLWNYAKWAYATDYFTWYIYDTPLLASLLAGCGAAVLVYMLQERRQIRYWPVAAVTLIAACCWCVVRDARPQSDYPYGGFQGVAYGITQEIKNGKYPECAHGLVGSYSSGLIGLELGGRVVNLDGLANDTAARVRMSGGSIPTLLSEQKIGCFIEVAELLPHHPDYETKVLGQYPMGNTKIVVAALKYHQP